MIFMKRLVIAVISLFSIFLFTPILGSFYTNEMVAKDRKIDYLKQENDNLKSVVESQKKQLDLIENGYKLKAQDSTLNRKGQVVEFFRIYKKDIMIESSYNIDTFYVNKIYSAAEEAEVDPWIPLYYAYLENRYSPYDLKHLKNTGKKRIVVSNKSAYNLMQMTKIAYYDVNQYLKANSQPIFNWWSVRYDVEQNIRASAYYIKLRIMPIYEEFRDHPDVGQITFWYYNGGPGYYQYQLAVNNIQSN